MSRASEYIILCEDILHKVFVQRFLKNYKVPSRIIKTIPPPVGIGCGEQHVRTKYPNEVKAYRARQSKAITALIVVIDADICTVEQRQRQLENAAESAGVDLRPDGKWIVHLIPKRHIETWLAFLDDLADVDETTDYKSQYAFRGKESESHPLTDKFTEMFRQHQSPSENLPSLKQALHELERLRNIL